MQIQAKPVLITGAGRGIGRAIALACARERASLGLVARTRSELEETCELAKKAGAHKVEIFVGDVGDLSFAKTVVSQWPANQAPIFGLVCAAAMMGEIGPLELNALEVWEKTLRVNVLGSVAFAQAVIPSMRKGGGGRIVFFSGGGQGGQARRTAYASSKGAIWRLTESLAGEVEEAGIFVNAIAPGAVNTKFLQDVLDAGPEKAGKKEYAEALEQHRKGGTSPEKAAELVRYLLSEKSKGLTGKILSALWDPFEAFEGLEKMSRSDIYTVRRVIDEAGSTRVK